MILFFTVILICKGSPCIFAGDNLIDLTAWDCIGLEYKGALGLYSLFIIIILSNLYKIFLKYIPALELDILSIRGLKTFPTVLEGGGQKEENFGKWGKS